MSDIDDDRVWDGLKWSVLMLALAGVLLYAAQAFADGPSTWWRSLYRKEPSGGLVSCCGEGDAVYADVWSTDGKEIVVTVTGRGPRNLAWAPVGRTYRLKGHYLVDGRGNPTSHAILFVSEFSLEPICFIPGAGI